MSESRILRPNRVFSAADLQQWEEMLRNGSGRGRYSRAPSLIESAVRTVARDNASVWIFDTEAAIEESQELTSEEKKIVTKVLREQDSYAGWLRVGFGPRARLNAMELLQGEEDYEITRPYYGGH